MSEPQDVLQALREALAGKEDKRNVLKRAVDINNNPKQSKSEEEDDGPQKVKSKNVS